MGEGVISLGARWDGTPVTIPRVGQSIVYNGQLNQIDSFLWILMHDMKLQ